MRVAHFLQPPGAREPHAGGCKAASVAPASTQRDSSRMSSSQDDAQPSSLTRSSTSSTGSWLFGGRSGGGSSGSGSSGLSRAGPSRSDATANGRGQLIAAGQPYSVPPWIINPSGRRKTAWDVWMALMIIYSVLVVPVRVGFAWRACIFQADWWWDFFVDGCFAVDIILTFRTAVIVESEHRNQQMLISDVKAIAIKCARLR